MLKGGLQMYAIVEVGAKQYSVKKDDVIEVERQEIAEGKEIKLDKVLLVSDDAKIEVGQPYLKDVKVAALVLSHTKGPKIISYKYRRRKTYHRKKGHRQSLTMLKIKEIAI